MKFPHMSPKRSVIIAEIEKKYHLPCDLMIFWLNNVQWLKLTPVQLDTSTLRKDMNYQIKITLALILIYRIQKDLQTCSAKLKKESLGPWAKPGSGNCVI